jgi:hypothetical protein
MSHNGGEARQVTPTSASFIGSTSAPQASTLIFFAHTPWCRLYTGRATCRTTKEKSMAKKPTPKTEKAPMDGKKGKKGGKKPGC